MMDYFKLWRRRLGIVALAMACVFTAAWVRGTAVTDQFCLGDSKGYRAFEIRPSCLLWGQVKAFGTVKIGAATLWAVYPKGYRGSHLYAMHLTPTNKQWEWRWNRFGFDFGRTLLTDGGNDSQLTLWVVPHWSIVIPLTMLSVWLLLWKTPTRIESQTASKVGEP